MGTRLVKLTVIYDMDDPEKPLDDELQDWYANNVNLQDIVEACEPGDFSVTLTEYEAPRGWDKVDTSVETS